MSDDEIEPVHALRPTEARWTHIALRVRDLDATIAWYTDFTPLDLIDRREDDVGRGAWLGMTEETNNPFLLVVVQYFEGKDPFGDSTVTTLGPFAHLGIELPERAAVDAVAAKAEAAGCLVRAPQLLPPPIGYITMVSDPDGNTVEFSWDQGVYAKLQEHWAG